MTSTSIEQKGIRFVTVSLMHRDGSTVDALDEVTECNRSKITVAYNYYEEILRNNKFSQSIIIII